jgi:hypothetical protein
MVSLLGKRIAHNFPPKEKAGFSQRVRIRIPKDDEVGRLACDNKIFVIAPDHHSSPRPLKRTIDHISSY